jgi:hypothetical protein
VAILDLTAKQSNRLLIHRDMKPVTLKNSVDIILTPQFYTFLREDLELKFAYQVKQIAGSLFDDYVDTSLEYQYHVYKCESSWCFIAYNIEEIDKFLVSVGIEKHRVSKIYFAQELSAELSQPLSLSGDSALQSIDGVVTMVPKRFIAEDVVYQTLDLERLKLKGGVTMGASLNSFVSLKETIILGTLFTLLGITFIAEGVRTRASISQDDAQLTALLDENPNYASSMLRQSILDKYQPINNVERSKRQAIKDLSKLLSAKSQLKELLIDKNSISANIVAQSSTIGKQVKEHAGAKKFKVSGSGTELKVEKKL